MAAAPAIRPLATDDERAACVRMTLTSEPFLTLGWDTARAERALSRPDIEVYVAADGPEIVGYAAITMTGPFVGYLQTLYVAEAARGQGVGSRLLTHVEERIFRDAPNVFLCVSGFNRFAQRFYRRHGYAQVGELRDYLVPGEAELLMRKSIGPIYRFRREPEIPEAAGSVS